MSLLALKVAGTDHDPDLEICERCLPWEDDFLEVREETLEDCIKAYLNDVGSYVSQ